MIDTAELELPFTDEDRVFLSTTKDRECPTCKSFAQLEKKVFGNDSRYRLRCTYAHCGLSTDWASFKECKQAWKVLQQMLK